MAAERCLPAVWLTPILTVPWVSAALRSVRNCMRGSPSGAGRHAAWRQHLQSASSATAAYRVTSAAILILHAVQPSAGMRWEQLVYLGASFSAAAVLLRPALTAWGRDVDRSEPRYVCVLSVATTTPSGT